MSATTANIRAYSYWLTQTALLCAVGILIPMFMPIRVMIEPMSFTLASHVAIFIAMFISPASAVAVTLGTTIGFFLAGFPTVVVMRAGSHIAFAIVGSLILKRRPSLMNSPVQAVIFSFLLAVIHAVAEVAVVVPFYFGGTLPGGFYARGFVMGVIILVGVGTVIHSMVDFAIARLVWHPLQKMAKPARA